MHAVLFSGPKKLDVIEYNPQGLSEHEILIKVGACGVCATDFHIYHGESPARPPVVIGHEYNGEVVEVGKKVKTFKPGDHVAVDPNIPCNECEYCRTGRIHLCRNLEALGVTVNGGFSNLAKVPVSQAYLIPEDFPYATAAFAEPLSCCIHGIDQADIKINDTVIIVGAGAIGLQILQLARLKGPKKVIVFEKAEDKKQLALHFGADKVMHPDQFEAGEISGDVVIECVGTSEAAELSFRLARHGGRIVIFGLAPANARLSLPLQNFFHKELTIKSSLLNPFTFKTAVDLLVSGKVRTDNFNISKVKLSSTGIENLFQNPRDSSIIKYMLFPNS